MQKLLLNENSLSEGRGIESSREENQKGKEYFSSDDSAVTLSSRGKRSLVRRRKKRKRLGGKVGR